MQKLHEIFKTNVGRGVEVYFRGCSDDDHAGGVIIEADDELLKLEYCIQKKNKAHSCCVLIKFSEIRAVKFWTPDYYDKNFQCVRE